jgi:hypothetical protein
MKWDKIVAPPKGEFLWHHGEFHIKFNAWGLKSKLVKSGASNGRPEQDAH